MWRNIILGRIKLRGSVAAPQAGNPGSIPTAYTKPSGLVAQFCNPATGGQGYLDGAGHLGLNTWLGLDLSFHC